MPPLGATGNAGDIQSEDGLVAGEANAKVSPLLGGGGPRGRTGQDLLLMAVSELNRLAEDYPSFNGGVSSPASSDAARS